MAENTLLAMYRGGMFDHVGFGFCRYSTDDRFLVPHFEKMLYDNALLILAYCKGYTVSKKQLYLDVAEKTADYILREMTSPEGAFYSSQDADSEGEEGKYYLFTPNQIIQVLGQTDGERFNRHFDITDRGNFEGKNIPNLLKSDLADGSFADLLPRLEAYRKQRHTLHRDEKILTCWNGLMISALCQLYLVSKKQRYLDAAKQAESFLQSHLCDGDTLFVSYHLEVRGVHGFLDDYAACIFAQLALYRATLDETHLNRAKLLCKKVLTDFGDEVGGFYLYGEEHETLILRPKETYDGAIPSGNSLMAYNLVTLSLLTDEECYKRAADCQLGFLSKQASPTPMHHSMFLSALLLRNSPPMKVTVVSDGQTDLEAVTLMLPSDAVVAYLKESNDIYALKNGETTYYVCKNNSCLPPGNDLAALI